jgi:hypothetical protein
MSFTTKLDLVDEWMKFILGASMHKLKTQLFSVLNLDIKPSLHVQPYQFEKRYLHHYMNWSICFLIKTLKIKGYH